MDNIIKRLGNLITVKSILTILLTLVFAVLVLRGEGVPESFTQIYYTIVIFYFGTQKIDDTKDKNNTDNK